MKTAIRNRRMWWYAAYGPFTIRYREDIKPGMWVRFQGDKWNISTLGEYSFKRTYLGLKASIAKGVSG